MDRHIGLPHCNSSVIELKRILNLLLNFRVEAWPWIDLITIYVDRNIGVVKLYLDETCQVIKPERQIGRGERRIVYQHAWGEVRLHWKYAKFPDGEGGTNSKKIGWIKLPDRPPHRLQEIIANILWQAVGENDWWYYSIEWGADIIPEDFYASGSMLRRASDPLMPVAAVSQAKGVPPALVEIQDLFERTFHLNHGRKGIKYKNERDFTTAYWGTRDRLTRVKVYPGPKNARHEEQGFLRFELTKESQALDRCLKAQKGGLYFPVRPSRPDIREFGKLLVPKDMDRLVKTIHRREVKRAGPSRYDKLMFKSIQKRMETAVRSKPLSELREDVQDVLGGANLGYYFRQLYPVIPESVGL